MLFNLSYFLSCWCTWWAVVCTSYIYDCVSIALHVPTLSSWESGWSRLCCWMAIGGGSGTASAPSSPSSSPQLCMPDEEDLDRVPLLSPSLRIRWREIKNKWSFRVRHGHSYSALRCVVLLLPGSHLVAWRRCRQSPSASRASRPCSSSCHRGSSYACGRAFWRGRRLYRSWAAEPDLSATSLACFQDVWDLGSCEDPGFGWSRAAGRHCWIRTRCLNGQRKENEAHPVLLKRNAKNMQPLKKKTNFFSYTDWQIFQIRD